MASSIFCHLASSLESGEHSEFTIICEGKSFSVHRLIVTQSPVIAAPLHANSNYRETEENIFTIKGFNVATVERMLKYMYSGTYEVNPVHSSRDDSVDAVEHGSSHTTGNLVYKCATGLEAKLTLKDGDSYDEAVGLKYKADYLHLTKILCHVRVSQIADFYALPGLVDFATCQIQTLFRERWSLESFMAMAENLSDASVYQNLSHMAATIAVDHMAEIVAGGRFAALDVIGHFSFQLLQETTKMIADAQAEIERLTASAYIADAREESTDRFVTSLNQIQNCRQRKAAFGRYAEEPESSHGTLRTPRRSKCRTRHYAAPEP